MARVVRVGVVSFAATCSGLVLAIAASAAERPLTKLASVKIADVPHVRQEPDFCGEACAQMWLNKLGERADQNFVFDQSGLDPALGRGCYTVDLVRALTAIGFQTGPVWQTIRAADRQRELDAAFRALHADLVAGVPSIVCMHYADQPNTTEHFRLVLGYDSATDEVIYNEPAEEHGAYRRMPRTMFLKLWPLGSADHSLFVVRIRLEGDKLLDAPPPARGERPKTPADFAQHILRLKRSLPTDGRFTVVIQSPFVVIGDESPETVKSRSEHTVKWAVDHIKQSYFSRDPQRILDIWLFKDKASYKKNVKEIFDEEPTTPYGYFSAADNALIMNIATGGGTLVHEIVHPYMAANFPKCPTWFNEGLASLYEHAGEEDGRIHGYPNWRLPGLQQAIRAKAVPSFEKLCGTTTEQFYGEDRGTNYSQARYLCYYLQEKGLLEKYYREFHAHAAADPTGYKTLQKVLGETDMPAFQKRWEAYVMKLDVQ
ncbi:MAG TPA: C39 family peptidase [Pirellulales bacterium]|nr:C39 family peptidase [Pirellulales bacterium]